MNDLIVYGLNYHCCPVAIRERFTIPESCLGHALLALKKLPHIVEAAVLSTCNRTEVYAVTSNVAVGYRELESFFQSARQITDHQALQANFKLLRSDVALHLMRVASGLDSMVLGEGQIMSQVKAAHQAALCAGTAGAIIDGLFKAALNCGKKVRSQTSLGKRAVSISSAAVELTRKLLNDLDDRSVCVVGAGRMAQICIKLLLNNHKCSVYVTNRSNNKTKALLAANTRHLNRLHIIEDFAKRHEVISSCDAAIIATTASEFLLTPEGFINNSSINEVSLESARASSGEGVGDAVIINKFCPDTELTKNQHCLQSLLPQPLYLIDMSVPRNVDPRVAELAGIQLHNFDDLASIVKQNLAEREALTKDAEIIIFAALNEFEHWQQTLMAVPVIAQLRGKVESIRQSHLERHPSSKRKSKHPTSMHLNQQLDKVSRVLINEILHRPTTKLKTSPDLQSLQKRTEVLQSLFDLES